MRVVGSALVVAGDISLHNIGQTPANDSLISPLFIVLSVVAGFFIARWWALLLATTMLVIATTMSTGTEDTRGFLVFAVGIVGGRIQAVLIGLGVAAAKILAALRRTWRRRASPGG